MVPLIRARVPHARLSRVAAQSPNLSTLVQNTSSVLLALHRGPAAITFPSRCFWWGRHGYRNKYSSGTAAYHKCLEAQSRIAKSKTTKDPLPLHRSSYPIYYSHGHGWRLASSWGKSKEGSNEMASDKSKSEAERGREWRNETEKWQEEMNTYLERLRKRVASHPYETLFGGSTKNGVWNPWGVDWDNWMRNLGWKDLAGGKFGSAKAESPEQAFWRTAGQGRKEGQESKPSAASQFPKNTSGDSGDIDLITLRRIQKDTPTTAAAKGNSGDSTQYDIPVKKLEALNTEQNRSKRSAGPTASPANVTKPLITPSKAWLAKEGFSEEVRGDVSSESGGDASDKATHKSAHTPTDAPNPRLESSLERHLRTVGPPTWEPNRPRSALSYSPEENKTEDIDLLRASNIRAAAGRLKKPPQEAAETREERREKLQASFVLQRQEVDENLAREIRQRAVTKGQSQTDNNPTSSVTRQHSGTEKQVEGKHQGNSLIFEGLNLNQISSEEKPPANVDAWGYDLTPKGLETAYQDELENKIQMLENYYAHQQQELIEAEEQRMAEKRKAADAALEEEIKAQKAAMAALEDRRCGGRQTRKEDTPVHYDEGDVSSKVSKFPAFDRSYKSKATQAAQQVEQKANDTQLVREIRQIYEERYGNINTQHRQSSGVLTMEGGEDPAVQEGLHAYDEKAASGKSNSERAAQVCLTDLEQAAVQEGLKEYDEKITAKGSSIGTIGRAILPDLPDKAVQEGLREYEEKTAKEEKISGTTDRFASTEIEDPAVQEGLRDYDEKVAAKKGILSQICTVQKGLRDYDEKVATKQGILGAKDTVQEGLRDYDEKVAAKEDTLGAKDAVQEGLRDYDEKIAAQEHLPGAKDAVQEGLRDYEEKTVAQEYVPGAKDAVQEGLRDYDAKIGAQENVQATNDTATSSEVGDRADKEGLRKYDEKVAADAIIMPIKGSIASTDLDSQEIALLVNHESRHSNAKTPANPSPTPKNTLPKKVRPATSTYKVLAYDPTTDSIATATTTSSLHESLSAPRSASSILTHLENPAKYFDHFEPLEAAGYELAAGSRRALVFKKVRENDHSGLKAMRTTLDKSAPIESPALASNFGNLEIPEQAKLQHEPHEVVLKESEDVQGNIDNVQSPGEMPPFQVKNQAALTELAGNPYYKSKRSRDAEAQRISRNVRLTSEREELEETECLRNPANNIDGTTADTEPSTATDNTTDAPTAPSANNPANKASSLFTNPQAQTPVRREEEVFSGSNIVHEERRERKRQRRLITLALRDQESRENSRRTRQRVWRFLKRFIWNGAWVAGCFYLVGALLEEVYRPRKSLEAVVEEKGRGKGDGKARLYEYHDM